MNETSDRIIQIIKEIKELDKYRESLKSSPKRNAEYNRSIIGRERTDKAFSQLRKLLFELYIKRAPSVLGYDSFQEFCKSEFDHPSWIYVNQLRVAATEYYVFNVEVGSIDRSILDRSKFKAEFPILTNNCLGVNEIALEKAKVAWETIKSVSDSHPPKTDDFLRGMSILLSQKQQEEEPSIEQLIQQNKRLIQRNNQLKFQLDSTTKKGDEELLKLIDSLQQKLDNTLGDRESLKLQVSSLQSQIEEFQCIDRSEELKNKLLEYRDRQVALIPAIKEFCPSGMLQVKAYDLLITKGIKACKDFLRNLRDIEGRAS